VELMRKTGHRIVPATQSVVTTYPLNQYGSNYPEWPIYQTWERLAMVITVMADCSVVQDATGQELSRDVRELTFTFLFQQQEDKWVLFDVVPSNSLSYGYEFEHKQGEKWGLKFLGTVELYAWPKPGLLFAPKSPGGPHPNVYECYAGWQNDRFVQMYWVAWNGEEHDYREYFVGEIQLGRAYEGVVVSSKKQKFTPAGYERVSVEWPEFNQNYDLFARSGTGADVFEVLEPNVMALLRDTEPEASVEIVGNTLYVYYGQIEMSYSEDGYTRMLKILNALATRV
jgi:hypothetical protein